MMRQFKGFLKFALKFIFFLNFFSIFSRLIQLILLLSSLNLAATSVMNCSQVSHANQHCSLAKDLIDVDSMIIITSVVGSGFETASERVSTHEFLASYYDVKYFPKNFADFFPNWVIISIIHAKMKEIRKGDLKQFPNLVELDLSSNAISKIERNLFKFNEKLLKIRRKSKIRI